MALGVLALSSTIVGQNPCSCDQLFKASSADHQSHTITHLLQIHCIFYFYFISDTNNSFCKYTGYRFLSSYPLYFVNALIACVVFSVTRSLRDASDNSISRNQRRLLFIPWFTNDCPCKSRRLHFLMSCSNILHFDETINVRPDSSFRKHLQQKA